MMTYDWAKPGVKVVCLKTWFNEYKSEGGKKVIGPVEGNVYTLRDVFLNTYFRGGPLPACRLEEIRNLPIRYQDDGGAREQSFALMVFRPLVTKPLPKSLSCLLSNPKSIIVPDKFDYKKTWEPV
jgi:hypothetical protein